MDEELVGLTSVGDEEVGVAVRVEVSEGAGGGGAGERASDSPCGGGVGGGGEGAGAVVEVEAVQVVNTAGHEHIGVGVAVDVSGTNTCGSEAVATGGNNIRDGGVLEGGSRDEVGGDVEGSHCGFCGGIDEGQVEGETRPRPVGVGGRGGVGELVGAVWEGCEGGANVLVVDGDGVCGGRGEASSGVSISERDAEGGDAVDWYRGVVVVGDGVGRRANRCSDGRRWSSRRWWVWRSRGGRGRPRGAATEGW